MGGGDNRYVGRDRESVQWQSSVWTTVWIVVGKYFFFDKMPFVMCKREILRKWSQQ